MEGNVSTVSVALLSLKPQPSFSTLTEVKDGDPRSERREREPPHSVAASEEEPQSGAKEGKILKKELRLKGERRLPNSAPHSV